MKLLKQKKGKRQMVSFKVRLDSTEKIKDFVGKTFNLDFDIDLTSGRYVVDGKSIMGIFTLDLSREINVVCYSEEREEVERFKESIKDYIIK